MEIGYIVYYHNERGLGFIVPFGKDANVKENHVCFYIYDIEDYKNVKIDVKSAVLYNIEEGKKGLQAKNITIIEKTLTAIPNLDKQQIIGRQQELKVIEDALLNSNQIVIRGWGGTGKTVLSTLFVRKNIDKYKYIVWLNCHGGIKDAITNNSYLSANLLIDTTLYRDIKYNKILSFLNELRTNNLIILDDVQENIAFFCSALGNQWTIIANSRQPIDGFYPVDLQVLNENSNLLLNYLLENVTKLSQNEINTLIVMAIMPRRKYSNEEIGYCYNNLFNLPIANSIIQLIDKKWLSSKQFGEVEIHPVIANYMLEKYNTKINSVTKIETKLPENTPIEKYKEMIEKGNVETCINSLIQELKKSDTDLLNSVRLISAEFQKLKKDKILGILPLDYENLVRNQISHRLLLLIDEVVAQETYDYINSEFKETSHIKVFFSYAHTDLELKYEIEKQIQFLQRNKLIDTWYDLNSSAKKEIIKNQYASAIILILMSPDFLSSHDCIKELTFALELQRSNKAVIIPIILKPCLWEETDLKKFVAIPTHGKPVIDWANRHEALIDIAWKIKQRALEINRNKKANL